MSRPKNYSIKEEIIIQVTRHLSHAMTNQMLVLAGGKPRSDDAITAKRREMSLRTSPMSSEEIEIWLRYLSELGSVMDIVRGRIFSNVWRNPTKHSPTLEVIPSRPVGTS